jgi:hypothetical protein
MSSPTSRRYLGALSVALGVVTGVSAQVKVSENDTTARFEDSSFSLPDVSDPGDTYTIVIKAADKETSLKLPAGVTGLRIAKSALPQTPWTWFYRVQREKLASLTVEGPTENMLAANKVTHDSGRVLLYWRRDPIAKYYKVTMVSDDHPDAEPPSWGKESSAQVPRTFTKLNCDCEQYAWVAKTGDRIKWKVTAYAEGDVAIAESEFRELAVEPPWSKSFHDKGFRLQRSDTLVPGDVGKPALFGYQSNQKEGNPRTSAYLTEFALIWEPNERDTTVREVFPRASFEAKLTSTGSDKPNDALRLRLGAYSPRDELKTILSGNLKYDTERRTGTEKGSVEFTITPTFLPFGYSHPQPRADQVDPARNWLRLPGIAFTPSILFGGEVGRTFNVGSSLETRRNFTRARADLRFDVDLNFLARALKSPGVTAYAEGTYWRLWNADMNEVTYSKTGASFKLTDEVSLEFSYAVGRDTPTFNFTRTGAISLGIQVK